MLRLLHRIFPVRDYDLSGFANYRPRFLSGFENYTTLCFLDAAFRFAFIGVSQAVATAGSGVTLAGASGVTANQRCSSAGFTSSR